MQCEAREPRVQVQYFRSLSPPAYQHGEGGQAEEERSSYGPSQRTQKDHRDWVIRMQRNGFPPTRDIIITKAQMYSALDGPTCDAGLIVSVLNRVFKSVPDFDIRNEQIIKRVLNGVEHKAVVSM
uniref:AlNc14C196G8561 protein n=1 Tax=Albugo laibachii Nc14 TaxID=890382 RepID=F0WQ80_9STRA|nr:AlNc14C196G8561 [Albugo laibachii Nc14]|eukprot:CCA23486.1 AlNc14C196G8561 [Albugo laibachii Nc14]